jgi:hypothetical protein
MKPSHVGGLLAVVCAIAFWQLGAIGTSAIEMSVGPAAAPAAVVALLALMTAIYTVSAWRGQQVDESSAPDQSALPGSGVRLACVFAGGLLFIAGVAFLGFVLPATACGMLVARAFDAPFHVKSALICGSISSVLWLVFAKVLSVGLGPATPFGF